MRHTLQVLLFLLAAMSAYSASYTVINTNDSGPGSLRAAVNASNSTPDDDVLVFSIQDCPGGVCSIILTTGELTVNESASTGTLKIFNPEGPGRLIVSANHTSRIFRVEPGGSLTIDGLTLQDGNSDEGGAILTAGHCAISNSVLRRNRAKEGGAIKNAGAAIDVPGR